MYNVLARITGTSEKLTMLKTLPKKHNKFSFSIVMLKSDIQGNTLIKVGTLFFKMLVYSQPFTWHLDTG